MSGSATLRSKVPSTDPLGDILVNRNNSNDKRKTPNQKQTNVNRTVTIHPTFQKVLILLVLVVIFDAHYVYNFFTKSNVSNEGSEVMGVVSMKSGRMDGLADHVIAKLKNEQSQAAGFIRGLAAGGSLSSLQKDKLESDKRFSSYSNAADNGNKHQTRHKLEPSWKGDKRMNPGIPAQANSGYSKHDLHDETTNHLGLSPDAFNSLDASAKLEELSLEVQLWKGRYEMTKKKLDILEIEFQHGSNGLADHEINHLMYDGMDTEGMNLDVQKLANEHDDQNEMYDPKKTEVFEHSEETYGLDKHILKILHAAGVDIDEELAATLPAWEDIVSMYGDKPIISGLETCEVYRDQVKPEDRMIGPAGIFNTGTNLLFELLKSNCDIKEARLKPRREPKLHNGIRWQAPWGKHNPPSTHRNINVAKAWGKGIKQDDFFPVVLIKDPYSWMGSQCRHKYSSFWGHDQDHCPNLIRWKVTDKAVPSEVWVKFALEMKHYQSLLNMWDTWYSEWEQMSFPHLVTRFEDLLFHGEEVVRTACECVGGVFTDDFMYVEDSAKPNLIKVHSGSNGLVQAMVQYGNPAKRLAGFTERDMIYADSAMNTALMEKYGYRPPPPLLSQQE